MSSTGIATPVAPRVASRTLADRRPGHAVMTRLLTLLERDALGSHVAAEHRSWHTGALGEVAVGEELAQLPLGWTALHGVPAGSHGADIDHLVIGPGGVFVISTKHHPGSTVSVGEYVVWLNGFQRSGYQAELGRRVAQVASAFAAILGERRAVHPLLVFVGARSLQRSGDQQVVPLRLDELCEYLLEQRPVLGEGVVRALVAKAAQPATWDAPAGCLDEPDPTERFRALTVAPPAVAEAPAELGFAPRPAVHVLDDRPVLVAPVRRASAPSAAGRHAKSPSLTALVALVRLPFVLLADAIVRAGRALHPRPAVAERELEPVLAGGPRHREADPR